MGYETVFLKHRENVCFICSKNIYFVGSRRTLCIAKELLRRNYRVLWLTRECFWNIEKTFVLPVPKTSTLLGVGYVVYRNGIASKKLQSSVACERIFLKRRENVCFTCSKNIYFVGSRRTLFISTELLPRNRRVLRLTRRCFWNVDKTFGAVCSVFPPQTPRWKWSVYLTKTILRMFASCIYQIPPWLYPINTDCCSHILLKHHFINTIRHSMFRPLKGHLQRV